MHYVMFDYYKDGIQGHDNSNSHGVGETGPILMARAVAVTQAMARLVGNVVAKTKRYLFSGSTATENNETPRSGGHGGDDMQESATAVAPERGVGENGCARQGHTGANAVASDDDLFHFPHFDVMLSTPDHHYLDNREQVRDLLTITSTVSLVHS